MAKKTVAAIVPEKNEFDDHFLDVIGNEFKFDHAKGLAEWMKNSADAYSTTARVGDAEQYILLRFRQTHPKRDSVFECIDFVGMQRADIDKALKVWGLATAAKKGTTQATYGGHGNGGKFYMRQMFGTSRFITFRNGRLNVFGFDEKRRYGYARGRQDVKMTLDEALKSAGIDAIDIPEVVRTRWKTSPKEAGFTVVRGERPDRFSGRATVGSILDRLRTHPQARRLLAHKQVIYLSAEASWGKRLEPPTVAPREGFETPRVIELPKTFEFEGEIVEFRNRKYPEARLTLRTSADPLKSTELSGLNTIDILGEVGCIGSYKMNELGFMRYAPETEFIYGECECPILEDPDSDSVTNDRERLADNVTTRALLACIRQQVDRLAEEMTARGREQKKSRDLRQSSLFNQILDRWKNKFMAKLQSELFGGAGIGESFGGAGGGGEGTAPKGEEGSGSRGKNAGEKGESGGGSGEEPRKGPRFPRVLLSGQDVDPLDPSPQGPFHVDERQPPVYQRDVDIEQGIYWINTARPLATKLLDAYGASHPRWREYLFQRYVDIILKQSVYTLAKNEPEFTDYRVDQLIDDVTSKVHDAAAADLEQFLFAESLTGGAPAEPSPAPEDSASLSPGLDGPDSKEMQRQIRNLQKQGMSAEQIREFIRAGSSSPGGVEGV